PRGVCGHRRLARPRWPARHGCAAREGRGSRPAEGAKAEEEPRASVVHRSQPDAFPDGGGQVRRPDAELRPPNGPPQRVSLRTPLEHVPDETTCPFFSPPHKGAEGERRDIITRNARKAARPRPVTGSSSNRQAHSSC